MKGVAFKIGNQVYALRFTPEQEPSRIAVNALMVIYQTGKGNQLSYEGHLYHDSLDVSSAQFTIKFTKAEK